MKIILDLETEKYEREVDDSTPTEVVAAMVRRTLMYLRREGDYAKLHSS